MIIGSVIPALNTFYIKLMQLNLWKRKSRSDLQLETQKMLMKQTSIWGCELLPSIRSSTQFMRILPLMVQLGIPSQHDWFVHECFQIPWNWNTVPVDVHSRNSCNCNLERPFISLQLHRYWKCCSNKII